jgi:hypothetical protein
MRGRLSPVGLLFGSTLFISAALIFCVQPMFARMALPQLGGSPNVWNTCVVFFQAALLTGYLYAHVVTTRLPLGAQVGLHGLLLAATMLTLPIVIPAGWIPPTDANPVPWLLGLLGVAVGVPFVIASASAPLLQRWFSLTGRPSAADPYFLYAASNAGSLVSLLAYPLVVEPAWSLTEQSAKWRTAFALLGLLILSCGLVARRMARGTVPFAAEPAGAADAQAPATSRHAAADLVSWHQRLRWLALAAIPASLMLSVTTYLSTDVAAVPLLWILPLTCYLLSFVIAFAPTPILSIESAVKLVPALVASLAFFMMQEGTLEIWFALPLHLAAFFAIATALHLQLARARPTAEALTEFYVWIAAGGVIGGAFNAFVAPVAFTGVAEYPVGLVATCLVLVWTEARPAPTKADAWWPMALGTSGVGLGWLVEHTGQAPQVRAAAFMPLVVIAFGFSRRRLRFALAIAALLVAGHLTQGRDGVLLASRSFFGVLRLTEDTGGRYHSLWHGTTLHGQQSLDPARRREALTYYHPSGPIGQTVAMLKARQSDARVGAVGLGAGSLAAYANRRQHWTFFEIDPLVERIAQDPAYFTYLSDCGESCKVVLGDARLSLARVPDASYDLLVLDAFTSDAIPMHLLTRDAVLVYLSKLRPAGLLAFHVSNRHLSLRPVLGDVAASLGLQAISQRHEVSDASTGQATSEWIVMTREAGTLEGLASDARWTRMVTRRNTRVWTDDYSNIVAALGFR